MRKIILASISVLIFCFCSFAQSSETSPCPTGVSVTGPSGLVKPGEKQTFTADVDNPGNYKIEYNWSVSDGEIIEGQGTPTIKVVQPEESAGSNLTATVEVSVSSGSCDIISDSETAVTYCPPGLMIVDEISTFNSKLDEERLDNFAVTLMNNPNATAYILGKFGRKISESSIKAELNKIADYLIKVRNFDKSRITVATIESDNEEVIQFWIVPIGASPPIP